jgi:peptide/nickel transport system ATP-binding protein
VTDAPPLLEVEGLTIGFGQRTVVDGLSFRIAPGEIVALVGESGSGKTIAARSLLGLLPFGCSVLGGTARFRGEPVLSFDEHRLTALRGTGIGMIFQEPMTSLDPSMKIGRQMIEALVRHEAIGERKALSRAGAMLEQVRIAGPERALDSYPHQFSGGMRQRIAIAAAMLLRPALLIADEPTTALDVLVQKEVLELLVALTREAGTGVLLITHDLGLVAEHAHRIVVMRHGRLVEAGPARAVLNGPREAYTRSLLEACPKRAARARPPRRLAPILEVDKLSVSHAGRGGWPGRRQAPVRAVDQVSLRLERGETLAIVGESGSGKTSLARAILGLAPIDTGRVAFDQIELGRIGARHLAHVRRRIGMIFQDPFSALDPRLRVGAIIAEGLRHERGIGTAERTRRVERILAEVGMDPDFAGRFPHELSGGQRQRVNIARALIADPQLVIADEPVSALDVSVQAEILHLIERLQQTRGFACIIVSHNLAVVEQIADRVAVIFRGRILEEGPRDLIFDSPRHPYTSALLRAAPRIEGSRETGFRLSRYAAPVAPPPSGYAYWPWQAEPPRLAAPELVELGQGHKVACFREEKSPS